MTTKELIDEFIEILDGNIEIDGVEGDGGDGDVTIADVVGTYHEGCSGYFQVKLNERIKAKGKEYNLEIIQEIRNAPFFKKRD